MTDTYPTAHVRGRVVTRAEGRTLGWAVLDAAAADDLGREGVGWFVGGHPGIDKFLGQLGRLDALPAGGVWVVVPASKELVAELWCRWPHPGTVGPPPTEAAPVWRGRRVWVSSPERLRAIRAEAAALPGGVAGVVVYDPACYVWKARGGVRPGGFVVRNDRPQHVVDFRAALDRGGWQPPLVVVTDVPLQAVDTDPVRRAYGLNAVRHVAGDSFACWEEPIPAAEPAAV